MTFRPRLRPVNIWLEPLLAFLVVAALVHALIFFWLNAYLPQPFFYEPYDIWMDWFNTAYWAYEKGAYDSWGTVYPPLSFVILRLFSKSSCYAETNGYAIRECDWIGLTSLHGFFILNIVLVALTFIKIDRRTALPRSVALALGLPALFALERGNLVVVGFTFIILAFGPLLKSAQMRWLAAGMAVNLKVYLIAAIFPYLLRRRWRWFEGAIFATVLVYVTSFAILGAGTPREILDNVLNFSGLYQAITFLELWHTSSYGPHISLLTGQDQMVAGLIGSRNVELLAFGLQVFTRAVQGTIVIAAIAAWVRPEVVPMHRLCFFGLALAMIIQEPGGYTQSYLIFFVFMERWKGVGRCWAIVAAYLLSIPFDFILDKAPLPTMQESYLFGHAVFVTYYITFGPFVRPALVMLMSVALACVTVRDVWTDIRLQGWKTRWRFRHDAPIMVGTGTARPPQ